MKKEDNIKWIILIIAVLLITLSLSGFSQSKMPNYGYTPVGPEKYVKVWIQWDSTDIKGNHLKGQYLGYRRIQEMKNLKYGNKSVFATEVYSPDKRTLARHTIGFTNSPAKLPKITRVK